MENDSVFKINKTLLINIVAMSAQERKFYEELDQIEELGGNEFLERSLKINFIPGISFHNQKDLEEIEILEVIKKHQLSQKDFAVCFEIHSKILI